MKKFKEAFDKWLLEPNKKYPMLNNRDACWLWALWSGLGYIQGYNMAKLKMLMTSETDIDADDSEWDLLDGEYKRITWKYTFRETYERRTAHVLGHEFKYMKRIR